MKVGALYATLSLDNKPFMKALDGSESRGRGWLSRMGGIFKSVGVVAAAALAAAAAAVVTLGVKSAQAASDYEQSVGAIESVLKGSSSIVTEFGATAAQAFGLSRREVNQFGAVMSAQLKSMGFESAAAGTQAVELQKRAADMAATFGGSTAEALQAVSALMRGERDPIERYGVSLKQADINARVLALGLDTSTVASKKNAEAIASLDLLMEQTADTQGQFARESGTMAGMQARVGAVFENTMAAIGKAVMPVALVILPLVLEAMEALGVWVEENAPALQEAVTVAFAAIGDAVTWLAEFVWPLLVAQFEFLVNEVFPPLVAALMWLVENVIPAVQGAFLSTAESTMPILGAAIDFISTQVIPRIVAALTFVAEEVVPRLQAVFSAIVSWVVANWPNISSVVGQVAGAFGTAFGVIAGVVKAVWPVVEAVAKVLFPVVGFAAGVLLGVLETAFNAIGGVFEVVGGVARHVFTAITRVWGGMAGFFGGVWDGIAGVFKGGINFVIDLVNGFIRFLNNMRFDIPRVNIPGTDIGVGGGAIDPFNIGLIPHLARGVRGFAGGLALIGERGPELAELPAGTNVYSAGETRDRLAGSALAGSRTYNIYGMQPGDVEREIKRAERRTALQWRLAR